MGNKGSSVKDKGERSGSVSEGPPLEREQYRSFDRSDTRESTRSIRNSIRSKIPGTIKTDSPRNSVANLNDVATDDARSDAASTKSRSRHGSTASAQLSAIEDAQSPDEPLPPPSPVHGTSLGTGHDQVDAAQRTGEVDHVSDAPPSRVPPPSSTQQPGVSILQPNGRPIPRVPQPPAPNDGGGSPMETSALKPTDLDDMIQRLLDAAYTGKVTKTVCLKNAEINTICVAMREVLLNQPALLELAPPVKIVGDVHGQYTDLIRMFEMCGFPPNSNYLFLGDYVDRGKQSLETILLLFCYKLKFPENFFLLRGNHECANVTRVYGFYDECKRRCNIKIWKGFVDTFNCLPIAAIVAQKIFCVHGGLSPSLAHMDDIRNIARPTDVPDYGLLNDLLWSDPADMENDWESNERGVSYCFGKKVIMEFLQRHDFDLVCRAHMVVEDGYEFFNDRILVTVFSAPNYCGEFDNWGAVMSVSGELLCSFELLKPLDSSQLKSHIKKSRSKRHSMLNSPAQGSGASSSQGKGFSADERERSTIQDKLDGFERVLRRNSPGKEPTAGPPAGTVAGPSAGSSDPPTPTTETGRGPSAFVSRKSKANLSRLTSSLRRSSSSASSPSSRTREDPKPEDSDSVRQKRAARQKTITANRLLFDSTLPPATSTHPAPPRVGNQHDYINHGASTKVTDVMLRKKADKRKGEEEKRRRRRLKCTPNFMRKKT